MKLEPGQAVYIGGKKYIGEVPDEVMGTEPKEKPKKETETTKEK